MEHSLGEYHEKRDFKRTSEPQGVEEDLSEELRFVIQHHFSRREHYDFRLEWAGVLISFAVPKGPSCNPNDKRLAVRVENHPLEYRHFEGCIPMGEYGGGTVLLWDEGIWEPLGNVEEGMAEGKLRFYLSGKRLHGIWYLLRLKKQKEETKENWLLVKEKDGDESHEADLSIYDTSVKSGRTRKQIEEGVENEEIQNPFEKVNIQLASLAFEVPNEAGWVYEMKYDGYRMLAFVSCNEVRLVSRNNQEYQDRYYEIANTIAHWAKRRAMVLDGELVVMDAAGKTDFQALQHYRRGTIGQQLMYVAFDLLALDGHDYRMLDLIQRKHRLKELLIGAPSCLFYSEHVEGRGKESFLAACQLGMEGIVGKKASSSYLGGRNGDWIKLKCAKQQAFVVGGYTKTEERHDGISALLLGVYKEDNFYYCGRVGTGMSNQERCEIERQLKQIVSENTPFLIAPEEKKNERISWVMPRFLADVRFVEWTNDGLLRHASLLELKTDSFLPDQVKKVSISSQDKVIYEVPLIRKGDVADYYEQVAPFMLPYLSHRIFMSVRCPKGVSNACFYHKHPKGKVGAVEKITLLNHKGNPKEYAYLENSAGLLYEVQMGSVEFHIWGSKIETLEQPDIMVFDLDPEEGLELSKVRQGALDVRSILSELSLPSYLKTSGGKGYHIVVPIQKVGSWEDFNAFAKGVAKVMEQKWPDRYTSNVRKVNRKGKIFVDWMRNGRGATSISPYSLRARAGAKVSMPIYWEELGSIAPDGIDMYEALRRIRRENPWKNFFQDLL
ncbi:MAG: bifunctional non-ous end joining protein LigD [Clostridiales bacterium]|nr:bifunctional non-ous end joining protein LigD [Clostridiales bacterium]